MSRKGPESPVYDVTSESWDGKLRTLHRNLLLPCDYLPPENDIQRGEFIKTKQRQVSERREKHTNRRQSAPVNPEPVDSDSDSDGEERPSALPNDMNELHGEHSQQATKEMAEENIVTPISDNPTRRQKPRIGRTTSHSREYHCRDHNGEPHYPNSINDE